MNSEEKVLYVFSHIAEAVLSIPKTLYFNFKVLKFKEALRLPVLISYKIKLRGVNRKTVTILGEKRTASIRIGFGASRFSIESTRKGMINLNHGSLVIGENSGLSEGVIIDAKNAKIVLGKHFRCNYATLIAAENDDIIFGDEVVLGWKINIRNCDGHYIIDNGVLKDNHGRITIGNHVWICAHSDLMKGASVGDDSVVAYGSMVNKSFEMPNVLIAGRPAKVIREAIDWQE